MEDTPARRFQFTLVDILSFLALACLSIAVLGSYLLAQFGRPVFYWPPATDYSTEAKATVAIFILVFCSLSSVAAVYRASKRGVTGWRRGLLMVLYSGATWFGLGLAYALLMPTFVHSRLPSYETGAGASCKAFAMAQEIYFRTDWDADGVQEYAQSLQELGRAEQIDPAFANAEVRNNKATPKYGYVYKVLVAKKDSDRKLQSFLTPRKDGQQNMTGGYALLACPAMYGESGINCFMINNTGTIYQCDFGPDTAKIFDQISEFDLTAVAPNGEKWIPTE